MPLERILRLPEVLALTGVTDRTILRWRRDGLFPNPVPIGPQAVGWRESEVERWQQQRFAAASTG